MTFARRFRSLFHVFRTLLVVGLVPMSLAAQRTAPPTIPLRPPNATLAEEFSVIAAVRELSDGRVLITDEKEGRLVVADFRTGTVRAIGRTGSGPGEYRQISRLWPLAGDTTVLKEPFNPRWIVLNGAEIVATLGPGDPTVIAVGRPPLMGSDTLGGMAVQQFAKDAEGRFSFADSVYLVRVRRPSLRADTITRLGTAEQWGRRAGIVPSPPVARAADGGASGPRTYVLGMQVQDQFTLFADGWIAVVRADPYRVDWCAPQRPCERGTPLEAVRPEMTARERRAFLDAMQRVNGWPPTTDVSAVNGWPSIIPPFMAPTRRIDGSPLLPLPDGRVSIERVPMADAMFRRYDVVSRRGELAGRLQLPLTERVVGFGRRTVYTAIMDEDGIERLRRHEWP